MVTNHVYTVAGAKGGVGKTTTSINLGATLARAGYRTAVVELDLAMANLVDFLEFDIDVTEEPTLHDVLADETDVEAATYELEDGLCLLPSGTDITGYTATDIDRLPAVVETLRWRNDVVLLDTPAGLSADDVRPLRLADEVVLVATPRVSAVRNAGNTLELADRVGTPVRGLVLTKSGTGASPGANTIAEFLDVELLGHVPEDEAVPHAQDRGEPVVFDSPNSGAATAYRKIGRALLDAERATTDHRDSQDRSEERGGSASSAAAFERREGEKTDDIDHQSVDVPAGRDLNAPGADRGAPQSDGEPTATEQDRTRHSSDKQRLRSDSKGAAESRPEATVEGDESVSGTSATTEPRTTDEDDEQPGEPDGRASESSSLGQQIRSLFGL
jgi:septum site-determining protein MinD